MKSKAICVTIPIELIEIMNKGHIDKSGLITGLLKAYFEEKAARTFEIGVCERCSGFGLRKGERICINCIVAEQKSAGGN